MQNKYEDLIDESKIKCKKTKEIEQNIKKQIEKNNSFKGISKVLNTQMSLTKSIEPYLKQQSYIGSNFKGISEVLNTQISLTKSMEPYLKQQNIIWKELNSVLKTVEYQRKAINIYGEELNSKIEIWAEYLKEFNWNVLDVSGNIDGINEDENINENTIDTKEEFINEIDSLFNEIKIQKNILLAPIFAFIICLLIQFITYFDISVDVEIHEKTARENTYEYSLNNFFSINEIKENASFLEELAIYTFYFINRLYIEKPFLANVISKILSYIFNKFIKPSWEILKEYSNEHMKKFIDSSKKPVENRKIIKKFINLFGLKKISSETRIINCNNVYIREGSRRKSSVLGILNENDLVIVKSTKKGWAYVEYIDKKYEVISGWVEITYTNRIIK